MMIKDDGFKINTIYNVFFNAIKNRYGEVDNTNLPILIDQLKSLDKVYFKPKSVAFVLSLNPFELRYCCSNIEEELGYTSDEMLAMKSQGPFTLLDPSHLDFPKTILSWVAQLPLLFKEKNTKINVSLGGLNLKTKDGKTFPCFIKSNTLGFQDGKPSYVLYFVENIKHLIKKDYFWAFFEIEGNQSEKCFFSTQDKGIKSKHFLSKRETEVLDLLNENKNTKEIAAQLNISTFTVDKHRKNMLLRLGAKDSTALLQLCKMCEIL